MIARRSGRDLSATGYLVVADPVEYFEAAAGGRVEYGDAAPFQEGTRRPVAFLHGADGGIVPAVSLAEIVRVEMIDIVVFRDDHVRNLRRKLVRMIKAHQVDRIAAEKIGELQIQHADCSSPIAH